MHIKIEIPEQRNEDSQTYGILDPPSLGRTSKILICLIKEITLETHIAAENHYFIHLKNRETNKSSFIRYEIYKDEYDKIANLLEKLNLIEIEEHNERAIFNKLPEKIIQRGDINGLLGLEV